MFRQTGGSLSDVFYFWVLCGFTIDRFFWDRPRLDDESMNEMEANRLVSAAYDTVRNFSGGSSALSKRFITRAGNPMNPAIFNSKVDPKKDTHHLTLVEAGKLMAFTGDYRVLHTLASLNGFMCVPVDDDVAPSDAALLEVVAAVWARHGSVGKTISDALSDGRIEWHEVEELRECVGALQQTLHTLVRRFEGMAG